MATSNRQLLDALSRMPFTDSVELAGILAEPHSTVHRALSGLLAEGIVGRVIHGTAHLPSSQRYHLTANGVGEAARVLGFDTPSDFVWAYPMSREWLTLFIRRMDAVAGVYRLAASMSPGIGGLRSRVEFHRRGRFDATITLHDGRSFGVVRQGLALRRRSLYDRLRAIAEYDYTRRPATVYVRMEGPEYVSVEELLRWANVREHELERAVRELEGRAPALERERDEARESASAVRQAYEELEEAYRKERAAHGAGDGWPSGSGSPWSRCSSYAACSHGDCSRSLSNGNHKHRHCHTHRVADLVGQQWPIEA